jgi:hypothetical protein
MNAQAFQVVLVFAVLALGLFAFLVGGKSSQAKSLKARGDDHGYHTTIEDLVKMTVGSVLVLAGTVAALFAMAIAAPDLLMVPANAIGDSTSFLVSTVSAIALAMAMGFYLGVIAQEKSDNKVRTGSAFNKIVPVLSVAGMSALLIGGVQAATTNMTEMMEPVSGILTWAGTDMIPLVIIVFIAAVPLIMIMIGVRFAGGMMSSLLDGIREIFTFKF